MFVGLFFSLPLPFSLSLPVQRSAYAYAVRSNLRSTDVVETYLCVHSGHTATARSMDETVVTLVPSGLGMACRILVCATAGIVVTGTRSPSAASG